jgi:hypothetical protein
MKADTPLSPIPDNICDQAFEYFISHPDVASWYSDRSGWKSSMRMTRSDPEAETLDDTDGADWWKGL